MTDIDFEKLHDNLRATNLQCFLVLRPSFGLEHHTSPTGKVWVAILTLSMFYKQHILIFDFFFIFETKSTPRDMPEMESLISQSVNQ